MLRIVLISPPPTSRPSSNLANIPPYKTHTFNYSQGQMSTRASGLEQHPNPSINYGIQSWPTLTLGPDTVNMPLSKSHVHSERHTIHVQGGRSSKYCDVDEHHPTANPQIMSPIKVAYSEETSVDSPGRVARTHRQVQNCCKQYAPPDIHDRPLMIPSPDSSNMSPYQNDTYSEEIDAYRDMTDIRREVEQCSDLYAPLNPHIKPPIAPCQNPANMTPQTNAKCHERDAVNVPRQVDIYKNDDQVNDCHEYPQSHVRPPRALSPKPANMSPCLTILSTRGKLILMPKDVMLIFMERSNHIMTTMAPLITVLGPPRPLVQTQPTHPCIAMFISTQETFILMERLSHVAITLTPLTPMLGLQCPPTQTQLTCYTPRMMPS